MCQSSYYTALSKENVKFFFKVPEDVSILWKMFVMIESLNYDILKINQIITVSEMSEIFFFLNESNTSNKFVRFVKGSQNNCHSCMICNVYNSVKV